MKIRELLESVYQRVKKLEDYEVLLLEEQEAQKQLLYQFVKEEEAKSTFLRDLLEWKTQMEALIRKYPPKQEEWMEAVPFLTGNLNQIIEEAGITTYRAEPGSKADVRRQTVAEHVPTEECQKAETVIKSLSPGYRKNGQVVLKEQVRVYKYQRNPQKDTKGQKEGMENEQ